LFSGRFPCVEQIGREEIAFEKELARLGAEGLRVEDASRGKLLRCADGVNAADEAADPFQDFLVVELGRAPAAARIDGEAKSLVMPRLERRDDGDLLRSELVRKGVLLVDLRVAPAFGAIEL